MIEDIEHDAILGMPFLRDYHYEIKCAEYILTMNGKNLTCTDRGGIDFVSKVQVIGNIHITSGTEQLVKCRLLNPICSSMGMIESSKAGNSRGLAIAASVSSIDEDRQILVRCLNPSKRNLIIPAGAVISTTALAGVVSGCNCCMCSARAKTTDCSALE